MGGHSTERKVSLSSGRNVKKRLDPEKYEVKVFDPAVDLVRLTKEAPNFDVAFPVLHGAAGEDGSIQGLLTLLRLPFVGSGVLASAICLDKRATKEVYKIAKLPVAPDLVVSSEIPYDESVERIKKKLGFPVVVKPLNQGSSVGLSIATSTYNASEALYLAFQSASLALVEKFLNGREFTVAVLGGDRLRFLPPIEIKLSKDHKFFDYAAKYTKGEAQEICPADLTPEETAKIGALAIAAHKALGCRGLSRTDFIYSDGVFFLLETNTLPGLTENSLLPKAALADGLSFPALLDTLIDLALKRA
jgi:D-alanine-D-alanine ligase